MQPSKKTLQCQEPCILGLSILDMRCVGNQVGAGCGNRSCCAVSKDSNYGVIDGGRWLVTVSGEETNAAFFSGL